MEYDDDDASLSKENVTPFDDDEEDTVPRKKSPRKERADDELVNQKRGYTAQERDMIEAWLKTHRPQRDAPDDEEE